MKKLDDSIVLHSLASTQLTKIKQKTVSGLSLGRRTSFLFQNFDTDPKSGLDIM